MEGLLWHMKKTIAILYLAIVVGFTMVAAGQQLSTIDTVQNLEISRAQDSVAINEKRIDALSASVSDLTGSVNRGTGIVIGIGSTLTVLQIVSMFMARRQRESR